MRWPGGAIFGELHDEYRNVPLLPESWLHAVQPDGSRLPSDRSGMPDKMVIYNDDIDGPVGHRLHSSALNQF